MKVIEGKSIRLFILLYGSESWICQEKHKSKLPVMRKEWKRKKYAGNKKTYIGSAWDANVI